MGREKYPTTSGRAYELTVLRPGRYQSIGNSGNGGGRVISNGCVNQQNLRQNIMLLQHDSNIGNFNGCTPEDQLVPG